MGRSKRPKRRASSCVCVGLCGVHVRAESGWAGLLGSRSTYRLQKDQIAAKA